MRTPQNITPPSLPEEIGIIEVCKYMGGWTEQEYLSQSIEFIEYIKIKMSCENRYSRAVNNMNNK